MGNLAHWSGVPHFLSEFYELFILRKKLQQKCLLTNRTSLFRMVAKKLVRVKVTTELRRSEKAAKLPITTSPITASPIMTNFAPVSLPLGSIFSTAGAQVIVTVYQGYDPSIRPIRPALKQKSSQKFPIQNKKYVVRAGVRVQS